MNILDDIKNGICITTDCKTYTVSDKNNKTLYTLIDEQIQQLVKEKKVKLIEQTRTYKVCII